MIISMKNIKKITPFHTDKRGIMLHLLDNEIPITSVLFITSKKDSVRAKHYHKKDTHYIYLLKGKVEYTYRDLKAKNSKSKSVVVVEGYRIMTPPMTAHEVKFLQDSEFLALTTEPRDPEKYEKDTVRVETI
jgi:dTDP-4-dehydrorhamnose 3,5-epimerase-like enzyme